MCCIRALHHLVDQAEAGREDVDVDREPRLLRPLPRPPRRRQDHVHSVRLRADARAHRGGDHAAGRDARQPWRGVGARRRCVRCAGAREPALALQAGGSADVVAAEEAGAAEAERGTGWARCTHDSRRHSNRSQTQSFSV